VNFNRPRPALAALALVVLALIFFWKLIFTNLILVGVDSFLYFYPYKAYIAQALRLGRLPLWNPYLFMGAPLLANMQAAVLYPLHWPLLWLPAPKQVAASIVMHVVLAGWGTLLFGRRVLRLGWLGALTAAILFALSGFVGAQAEHINQLNVIAWLPWAFLLLAVAVRGRWRLAPTLGLGLVIALMVLAGHAQATYICLAGLGAYALFGPKVQVQISDFNRNTGSGKRGVPSTLETPVRALVFKTAAAARSYLAARWRHLAAFGVALVIATLLSAAQLLPSLELSRLSVRAGGLPYREAASFSLQPWKLPFTLLPPYGVDLSQVFGAAYSEYVAYVGLIGLGLAALGLLRGWKDRVESRFFGPLAAGGLFLGVGGYNPLYFVLYKLVPGFDLFRAPARWMLLYTFGVAVLGGMGIEQIATITQRVSPSREAGLGSKISLSTLLGPVLLVLICAELFVAGQALRYNEPTAPEAFSFLRPSVAHLKTDSGLGRFLSLSGIVYDPGDLAEMQAIFTGQLPEKAIHDYVVAAKEKEVLSYNLPLLYGLYSVDGYDGGLLPLRDFVTMQHLFLDQDSLSLDGRLRESLRSVPPGRLLSLLGVKYVITDKVYDVWIDNLFYDLQFSARLSPTGVPRVEGDDLPDFPTTALGVISHLDGAADLPDGSPVARIQVAGEGGWSATYDLLAGRDTSEGHYSDKVVHEMARVGHTWPDDPSGQDYVTLIPIDGPHRVTRITVAGTLPTGEFVLRGLSLVDSRTTTTRQLTLSTEGHYRLVHSGDVKIYQNLDVLPRAFVVHQAEIIPDSDQQVARLRDPHFDPARAIILADGAPLAGQGGGDAQVMVYTPEKIVVQANTDTSGYLLLTDAYYPGWLATIDGQPAEILRADVMFRAVRLEPGAHRVQFEYRPATLYWGSRVSAVALLLWLVALIGVVRWRKSGNGSLRHNLA
jgi:hypothetical protein